MNPYLDSSATVKLFMDDEGGQNDLRGALASLGSASTSRLTYIETLAALASARRSGRMSAATHRLAVADFKGLWAALDIVDLSEEVATDAGEIAETFGLRAGDAIQLASARRLRNDSITFVAWDTRLRAAAEASGFACYPPEL